MKKNTFMTILVVMILFISSISHANDEGVNENILRFVAEWKAVYQKEGTWDLPDSSAIKQKRPDTIPKEDVLALAVQVILDEEDIELSFLEQYRPFIEYQPEEMWAIAITPKPMKNPTLLPLFFFLIKDGTGVIEHYNRIY